MEGKVERYKKRKEVTLVPKEKSCDSNHFNNILSSCLLVISLVP